MAEIAQRRIGEAAEALVQLCYIIYPGLDLKQFKSHFVKSYNPGVGAVDRGNTGVLGQVRAFFAGHVRASDYFDLFCRVVKVYLLEFFKVTGKSGRIPFSLERYQAYQMMSS